MKLLVLVLYAVVPLLTSGQYPRADEPLHCPPEGLYTFPHHKACDQYYLCRNGTVTHEFCPNGLLYSDHGAVYEFCAHQWNVDCKGKIVPHPISTPGCPWQFGFFAEDDRQQCNIYYSECVWGVPERKECHPPGLLYDDRIKGCQWPDQLGCKSENIIGFKCPPEDTHNKYWPYPRYYYNNHAIVTCVHGQPRLIHCGPDEVVEQDALTCQALYKEDKEPHKK